MDNLIMLNKFINMTVYIINLRLKFVFGSSKFIFLILFFVNLCFFNFGSVNMNLWEL